MEKKTVHYGKDNTYTFRHMLVMYPLRKGHATWQVHGHIGVMEWIGFVEPRRREDGARVKQNVCEIRDGEVDQHEILLKEELMVECPFRGQDMVGRKNDVISVVDNYDDEADMEDSGGHTEVQMRTVEESLKAGMEGKATSWHMKMKKMVTWPVKRLGKRKELLNIGPTIVKVQDDDNIVADKMEETSIQGCEEDMVDLAKQFEAIKETW